MLRIIWYVHRGSLKAHAFHGTSWSLCLSMSTEDAHPFNLSKENKCKMCEKHVLRIRKREADAKKESSTSQEGNH